MPIDRTDGTGSNNAPPPPVADTEACSSASSTNGVPQEEYAKAQTSVDKYLKIERQEPALSADGKHVYQSSKVTLKPGERPANSRSTPEGKAADAKLRKGVYRETGRQPGHLHGLSRGVDPAEATNVTGQNAIQNGPGGTWNQAEREVDKTLKKNPQLGMEEEVRTKTRTGSDTPISRQLINRYSDGRVTGENVHYGNFPSPASRAAEAEGGLPAGEAGRLDNDFRKTLKEQKGTKAEIERGQAEWRAIGESRRAGGSAAVVETVAEDAGKASRVLRGAGEVGLVLGAVDLVKAGQESLKEHSVAPIVTEAAGQAGGWAGAIAGAEAGAALGAALGIETGPGAVVTGLIGGVAGGIAGSMGVDVGIGWLKKHL